MVTGRVWLQGLPRCAPASLMVPKTTEIMALNQTMNSSNGRGM